MAKVCIIRGEHPDEVSAFVLAGRVAERLQEMGDDVGLKEVPWRKDYFRNLRTFLPNNMPMDQRDLFYRTLSQRYPDFTRVSFHNFPLYGYRGSFPIKPEDVKFMEFKTLYELYKSKWDEYPYINYRISSPPLERIVVEIPELKKKISNPRIRAFIQEFTREIRPITSDYSWVGDIKRTTEAGLMSPIIVDKIAGGLHELVTKLF